MKKSTMRNSTVALKHCLLRNISLTHIPVCSANFDGLKEQNAQISASFPS